MDEEPGVKGRGNRTETLGELAGAALGEPLGQATALGEPLGRATLGHSFMNSINSSGKPGWGNILLLDLPSASPMNVILLQGI